MRINPATGRSYGKPAFEVAMTRSAVEKAVRRYAENSAPRILVACSGGADSMALADATLFVAQRHGWAVAAMIVDHQLQEDSAMITERTASFLTERGYEHVKKQKVKVGSGGLETQAREARYAALDQFADEWNATMILTAHHRDDQTETVLLALLHGSGTQSLAGIPPQRGKYVRPLLELTKAQLYRACEAERVPFWEDPTNTEEVTARNVVRKKLLPAWQDFLHSDISSALAKTANICREDTEALDFFVEKVYSEVCVDGEIQAKILALYPESVRKRVLHRAAKNAGAGKLNYAHLQTLDTLVSQWHGQDAIPLPGKVSCVRVKNTLYFKLT